MSIYRVGFSAVLFALKVILQHYNATPAVIWGIQLPPKFVAWGELILIHVMNSNASFIGHFCGILAGLIFVHSQQWLGLNYLNILRQIGQIGGTTRTTSSNNRRYNGNNRFTNTANPSGYRRVD